MNNINTSQLSEGRHKLKKAWVYCAGVKRRCRSVNRHSFDLGFFDPGVKCLDLKTQAEQCISKNMKSIIGVPELSLVNRQIEVLGHLIIENFSSDDIFNREKLAIQIEEAQ